MYNMLRLIFFLGIQINLFALESEIELTETFKASNSESSSSSSSMSSTSTFESSSSSSNINSCSSNLISSDSFNQSHYSDYCTILKFLNEVKLAEFDKIGTSTISIVASYAQLTKDIATKNLIHSLRDNISEEKRLIYVEQAIADGADVNALIPFNVKGSKLYVQHNSLAIALNYKSRLNSLIIKKLIEAGVDLNKKFDFISYKPLLSFKIFPITSIALIRFELLESLIREKDPIKCEIIKNAIKESLIIAELILQKTDISARNPLLFIGLRNKDLELINLAFKYNIFPKANHPRWIYAINRNPEIQELYEKYQKRANL